MTRAFAVVALLLLFAPGDGSAQRISTWESPSPAPVVVDTVLADAGHADLGEQAFWGVVVGSVAGLTGRAYSPQPDPLQPARTNGAAGAYDASVFDVLDFTVVGAASAAIAAAAAEWARDRVAE